MKIVYGIAIAIARFWTAMAAASLHYYASCCSYFKLFCLA